MEDSQGNCQQDDREGEESPPPRLAEDQFYRVLAASNRRRLLYHLLGEEESSVDELATVLSEWQATITGTTHTSADRSELRLTLVHNHLPGLDEAGLIDYNPQSESVQLSALHPQVTDIICQSIEAEQRPDS
jgi:DNA-binding transcriptional ArsR family regulator